MKFIAAAIIAILATQASAQSRNCGPRDKVLEKLTTQYSEVSQSRGISSGGNVMEVFANLETGTWTATISSPEGEMCFVASGEAFERINEELPTGEPT